MSSAGHIRAQTNKYKHFNINGLHIGTVFALLLAGGGEITMAHTNSQKQIQHSMTPMLITWSRCISWTVLLSALLAILFALLLDGCSRIH